MSEPRITEQHMAAVVGTGIEDNPDSHAIVGLMLLLQREGIGDADDGFAAALERGWVSRVEGDPEGWFITDTGLSVFRERFECEVES